MKYITYVVGVTILLITVGCATHKVPHGGRVVGGGLQIEWRAPEEGTVILIEETTGKTIATKSLIGNGDAFTFDATTDPDKGLLREMFEEMPENARFVSYFVPASKGH